MVLNIQKYTVNNKKKTTTTKKQRKNVQIYYKWVKCGSKPKLYTQVLLQNLNLIKFGTPLG